MPFSEILVLIPAHSLEDFPTELGEAPAESLLNAFVVAWHPRLLAASQSIPRWRRADVPVPQEPGRVVFVPKPAAEWSGAGLDEARGAGAIIIEGCVSRSDYLAALHAALTAAGVPPLPDAASWESSGSPPTPEAPAPRPSGSAPPGPASSDAGFSADCCALGFTWLMCELLTRCMRNFAQVDAVRLELDALAAARAIASGDAAAAEERLRRAFETLLECRERFYPVDCYLLDLCLLIPRLAGDALDRLLAGPSPLNVLAAAGDWKEIVRERPEVCGLVRSAWEADRLDVIGGEFRESISAPLSVREVLAPFRQGRETFERLFGRAPTTWGRRRFGLSPMLPQILARFGLGSALHILLDDGQYPDDEHARFRWQGCDGTAVDALSRIPLAADSASSFLRFPQRLAESMDHDSVVGLVLARWPELRAPFWDDLRRGSRYAPVLGRLVTFKRFFSAGDYAARLTEFKAGQYLSPTLVQLVARETADPISRFVDNHRRSQQVQGAQWCADIAALLTRGRLDDDPAARLDDEFAAADPESPQEVRQALDARLLAFAAQSLERLAKVIAPPCGRPGAGQDNSGEPGWLVVNPVSFVRKATVRLPADSERVTSAGASAAAPALSERAITGAAETGIADPGARAATTDVECTVELPACGFAWVSARSVAAAAAGASGASSPRAEPLLVRNEFFEVRLSDVTGGIAQVRTYRRSPNRFSQQLALRFPRERKYVVGEGDSATQQASYYSEMRLLESSLMAEGSDVGAIETLGVCVDPQSEEELAEFRQQVRVRAGRPIIEIEIELTPRRALEGDPWTNYFGVRWAWKNEDVAVTRSLHETAHPVGDEPRLEAPYFIELAEGDFRTTLLPRGLPFHRRTGPRMLDTLLITPGETRRQFSLAAAIDVPFPMEAALDVMSPPMALPLRAGPPPAASGWFMHLSARNVVLLGLHPAPEGAGASADRSGVVARLLETEGRRRVFGLSCFRTPRAARQIDFLGKTIQEFRVDGDGVRIEIAPYELCDVELLF